MSRRLLVVIAALLTAAITDAAAQSPPDRAALHAFRDSVGVILDAAELDALRDRLQPAARAGGMDALRLAVVERWRGTVTGERSPLDAAWARAAEVARKNEGWTEAWYELALTKLALHDGGFTVKEGPYQPMGRDWLQGAADALIRALAADSSYVAAAERLATTVLRQTIQPQYRDAIDALRRAAAASPDSAAVHLSRGLIERELQLPDSAALSFERYLATGGDPAVGRLELARTLFDAGDQSRAERLYYEGAAEATSLAAVAHYRADLRWIALPEELAAFDSLFVGRNLTDTTAAEAAGSDAAEARVAWLRAFWDGRDAGAARAPGERIAEHYRRHFYAMRNFRRTREPRQDGSSVTSAASHIAQISGMTMVTQGGETPESQRSRVLSGSAAAAVASASPGEVYARLNSETLLRAYRADQSIVDDRGVIYIRHGEPDERASYRGAEVLPNESWMYRTPEGKVILHFSGSVAPTTLVENLQAFGPLYASRGKLDPMYDRIASELTPLGSDVTAGRVGGITIRAGTWEDVRQATRAAISTTTTTDDYPLDFDRDLAPVVQSFGLRQGLGGAGGALVVVAVDGGRMTPVKVGPDSVIAYPLVLRIIAKDEATGAVRRLDTTRMFATRAVLGEGQYLTAQSLLPLPPGRHRITVMLGNGPERGNGWERGAVVTLGPATVPDLAAGALSMSDLVLGREGSGQVWRAPDGPVALNPLNTVPRGGMVEVYYQVGGLAQGREYRTTVEVSRIGSRSDRVRVEFRDTAAEPRQAVRRSIGLERLKPGRYILEVTLSDDEGTTSVQRSQTLVVTE